MDNRYRPRPSPRPPGRPSGLPSRLTRPGVAAPPGSEGWTAPWVQLRTFSYHPCLYPAMLGAVSPDARPGDWVTVYDKSGRPFGAGLYNPQARVPLRVLQHGDPPAAESHLDQLVDQALELRLGALRLPESTDAFRVVHSDGDSLSGLIVDKFADVLSVQVHSLGIWQRLPALLNRMKERLGTTRVVSDVDPGIARQEGIRVEGVTSDPVRTVKIREHGVRYEVDFARGHKTGFFCDQRENRRRLAAFCRGKSVLDVCCYTGGF
ncbi:MAG: class I SAM-dependent rRNA methyltransferase, partial [Verrucomicrobiota bacterium]